MGERCLKIGVQLYSARDDASKDMPGTLKKLAAIGYEAVEFYGHADYTSCEIAAALSESNLEICGWHTPWDYVQDEFLNAWAAYCKAVGNKYVIVPGLPGECTSTIENWQETADRFNAIAKKLAKHGLKLGYHNHWKEFMPINAPDVLPWDAFFEKADPEIIAQYDIGNSLHGTGIDALAYHKKYIGRGATVHAKSYSASKEMAAIGEDDINWAAYVAEIKSAGATDYIIVEYEHQDEAMYEKLATCYRTLKNLL